MDHPYPWKDHWIAMHSQKEFNRLFFCISMSLASTITNHLGYDQPGCTTKDFTKNSLERGVLDQRPGKVEASGDCHAFVTERGTGVNKTPGKYM